MTEVQRSALKQAYTEIPKAWYEGKGISLSRATLMVAVIEHGLYSLTGKKPLSFRFLGLGLFIAAEMADTLSTSTALKAGQTTAGSSGPGIVEVNPFLSSPKEAAEFKFKPGRVLPDLVGASASFYSLGIAIPLTILKTVATINNLRIASRFNRATQIAAEAA